MALVWRHGWRDAQSVGRNVEKGDALHAFGAAGPVTIVKVKAFALEDECADAVLEECQ